MLILPTMNG